MNKLGESVYLDLDIMITDRVDTESMYLCIDI